MHYNHATDGKEISYQCVAHTARYGLLPSQAPALVTRRNVLLSRVLRQERRLSVPSITSAGSPGCIQLCQQSDADGWALPALHGIQQQKQHTEAPTKTLQRLQDAYEQDASAVESEGLLLRSFVDWVHVVQVKQALKQQSTAAAVVGNTQVSLQSGLSSRLPIVEYTNHSEFSKQCLPNNSCTKDL